MTDEQRPENPDQTPQSGHDAEGALDAAQQAVRKASADASASSVPSPADESALEAAKTTAARTRAAAESATRPLDLPQFLPEVSGRPPEEIALLSDVNLNVKIELGRTRMLVEDVLRLGAGAVVELDKLAGDPVDVFVNERLVARGEVLVLNDNFCVRISEIIGVSPKPRDA